MIALFNYDTAHGNGVGNYHINANYVVYASSRKSYKKKSIRKMMSDKN